ncbi:hypothetical protein M5K25_022110 [Dendrobium thyrsiflorum]|uniref:Uncharacterized protein n=1 Tax=Dendrobium thyrsiflorum TaxID=117978 RepID=A0ABD0U5P2_DENTH
MIIGLTEFVISTELWVVGFQQDEGSSLVKQNRKKKSICYLGLSNAAQISRKSARNPAAVTVRIP